MSNNSGEGRNDIPVKSEAPGAVGPARYLSAAGRLHSYLERSHEVGGDLIGADPGIRFNARIGRFLKSYASFVRWSDDLVYLQAEGYWILDNWLLSDIHGDGRYQENAVRTSESVLARQKEAGYWEYPNPEWKGRIATVEGCFASLGLLESYERTGRVDFLEGARRWHDFMRQHIGFRRQADAGMLAVNYFAHSTGDRGGVPNNSTLVLWTAARLAQLTEDDDFLAESSPMLEWLADVQQLDGELPYAVGADDGGGKLHFLCYQYNAFEFMDLAHYHAITGDDRARPVMERLASYLSSGLEAGSARYECSRRYPEVPYYTLAVAQALSQATDLGMADERSGVAEAYRRTLDLQQPDGRFRYYSRKNYGVLSDKRSYPRYLSMMLHHLLLEAARPARGSK